VPRSGHNAAATPFYAWGTHAELIAGAGASLRRKPETLSFDQAGSVGVNYMAAWCGLEAAGLKAGEDGAVDRRRRRRRWRRGPDRPAPWRRVIGVDRHVPHPDAPIHAIAERLIVGAQDLGAEDLPAEVRAATAGKGADVVFDLVGGVMFRSAVNCLALRGRLVEIAVTGQREVSFDLADFYHNESRLFGVDTLKRDLIASAAVLEGADAGLHRGRLPCGADRGGPVDWARRKTPIGRSRRSVRPGALCCGRSNRRAL